MPAKDPADHAPLHVLGPSLYYKSLYYLVPYSRTSACFNAAGPFSKASLLRCSAWSYLIFRAATLCGHGASTGPHSPVRAACFSCAKKVYSPAKPYRDVSIFPSPHFSLLLYVTYLYRSNSVFTN